MGAQSGKDLLIKVDLTGSGQFESVAGLRATRISFNAESVDVTSLESQGGWRELLAGAGVKSAAIFPLYSTALFTTKTSPSSSEAVSQRTSRSACPFLAARTASATHQLLESNATVLSRPTQGFT